MKPAKRFGTGILLMVAGGAAALAQPVISATSGVVQYVEGRVSLIGQKVERNGRNYPQIGVNQILRTTDGRAEVLLTPGVFLRAGQNSAFRLTDDRLVDTRLDFLGGSIILEVDHLSKGTAVSVAVRGVTVRLRKAGIYRFDGPAPSKPAQLRVFKGSVKVEANGRSFSLGRGRLCSLTGAMAVRKFDVKETDELSKWSYLRAGYIARANAWAVRSRYPHSNTGGFYICADTRSSLWLFDSTYDVYTYLPCHGIDRSPYGFRFWSPQAVSRDTSPQSSSDGSSSWNALSGSSSSPGYSVSQPTSSGYSGTVSESYSSSAGSGSTHASDGGTGGVSRGGGSGGGSHR